MRTLRALALLCAAAACAGAAPPAVTPTAPPAFTPTFTPTAALPALLQLLNGSRVTRAAQWPARRAELRALLQAHVLGTLPAAPPQPAARAVNATCLTATCWEFVELAWGARRSTIQIVRPPQCSPAAPCPLLLTQWNHRLWAFKAAARGYVAIVGPQRHKKKNKKKKKETKKKE